MNIARILSTKGTKVITIRPEQPVKDAVTALAKHNIGALVVVNEKGEPVGLLSERDVIRRAAEDQKVFTQSVSDLMTESVITGEPQDELRSVAYTMTEKRFRHLPIMDQGTLVGIVSIGDVVKAQRDQYEGEVYTLESVIMANDR